MKTLILTVSALALSLSLAATAQAQMGGQRGQGQNGARICERLMNIELGLTEEQGEELATICAEDTPSPEDIRSLLTQEQMEELRATSGRRQGPRGRSRD
jgi:Spy/CpxP family protein refolding chaperone